MAGRTASVHLDLLNEALEEKDGSSSDMADGRLFLGKHGKWVRLTRDISSETASAGGLHRARAGADRQNAAAAVEYYTRAEFSGVYWARGRMRMRCRFYGRPGVMQLVDPGDAVTLKTEGATGGRIRSILCVESPRREMFISPDAVTKPASGRGDAAHPQDDD